MAVDQKYIISTVTPIVVEFTDEENYIINQRIKKFADKMKHSHEYYATKRNVKPEVAYKNNLFGKKGEFFARDVFYTHFKYPIIEPDLQVYDEDVKSFSEDLPFGRKYANLPNVHIKTCDSSRFNYEDSRGKSWTFQLKNNDNAGGTDPILIKKANPTDLVAFIYMEGWHSKIGIIEAIIPLNVLTNKSNELIEKPVSGLYKDIKRCVYLDTLYKHQELIEKCQALS